MQYHVEKPNFTKIEFLCREMILVLFDETQGESDVNRGNPLDNF